MKTERQIVGLIVALRGSIASHRTAWTDKTETCTDKNHGHYWPALLNCMFAILLAVSTSTVSRYISVLLRVLSCHFFCRVLYQTSPFVARGTPPIWQDCIS
jgi:hypothetical protein